MGFSIVVSLARRGERTLRRGEAVYYATIDSPKGMGMSVRMSDEELDQFLASHYTVTLVTLNPNGTALPTPLWYVNKGPVLYIRTMRNLQKAKNIARDPRVVAQVEDGLRYVELRGAILRGKAEEATDPAEIEWFNTARDTKYKDLAVDMSKMPAATQKHYSNPHVIYRLVPEKTRTWDNRKIRR